MHFPVPMPAFDVACIDAPYQAVGAWQNRVFAVPPAMGIDYRIVNGYVYISGNPVTDPAKIAERVEYFQRRAGHYYQHWDELYGRWRDKMEALIAEIDAPCPTLRVRAGRGDVRGRPADGVHRCSTPSRALRCGDRCGSTTSSSAARLRRVHDVQRVLQGPAPRHPGAAHRADGGRDRRAAVQAERQLARLAKLAIDTGVEGAFVGGARRRRSTPSRREREPDGRGWTSSSRSRTWFNMAVGDGLYPLRGWYDDEHPYASVVGYVRALQDGEQVQRPSEGSRASATGWRRSTGRCRRGRPDDVHGTARAVAHGLPVRRGHKFYCDYWF
jgi:pyruvate,water dikinase